MREAGRITARALRHIAERVRPGVSTLELDDIAEGVIREAGAIPAFKGYHGFPATICASLNNAVVHGIPSTKKLLDGDILSVDVGAVVDGYYADAAMTFPVGEVSELANRLMDATNRSLMAGVSQVREGQRLFDISSAIQCVAEEAGFSIVREYVGHGIGRSMHEEPQVPNFGSAGKGPALKEGMVFAIEPMINAGNAEVESLEDGWTVVTVDGSLSAHFEHTVAVGAGGPLIITVE